MAKALFMLAAPEPPLGSAKRGSAGAYDRYRVGVHHVAFQASSRAVVDERYAWARERGAEIESAPKEYDYMPDYYACFFLTRTASSSRSFTRLENDKRDESAFLLRLAQPMSLNRFAQMAVQEHLRLAGVGHGPAPVEKPVAEDDCPDHRPVAEPAAG